MSTQKQLWGRRHWTQLITANIKLKCSSSINIRLFKSAVWEFSHKSGFSFGFYLRSRHKESEDGVWGGGRRKWAHQEETPPLSVPF